GGVCALGALPDAGLHTTLGGPRSGGASGSTQAAGTLKVAELACDADFEYFSHYGTVAAVENRINTVINAMNAQYENEVGITHEITTIIVRTSSSQPYTSTDPNTLLNQFRTQWTSNHGNVTRDVAHLFTGKELAGSVIGIAWLGVICNSSYGYGLVQSDFSGNFAYSTDLSAHELGHNWNANHCTCPSYTMNPYITGANSFDPAASVPPITSFRDSVGCLADGGGDPPPPPDPNTGLATADYSTPSGTITGGTYASTHASDDAYEALTEQQSGGKPNVRYSLLEHVWTLDVPAGHNYSLAVEAHHTANSENDHFEFLYSLNGGSYATAVTVSKTADDDAAQTLLLPVDVAGTLFVKARDTDHTAGKKTLDTLRVDRLAVLVDAVGPDLTPPAAPTGLVAQAGNGQVSLDWADSNAQDLAGYLVSRATVSGGPYSQLNGAPLAASAFVDATASNGTTYYYVVKARDLAGNLSAGSTQASATPNDPNAPPVTLHVQQVIVSTQAVTAGWKQGRADVTVVDNQGSPVAGALVTGAFSGGLNQGASATTGANGVAVLTTFQTAKGNFALSFCVTDVDHAAL
ncbi:MAG TPA: zinc-dependent metalloprotease family protein, partial [Planctomycetota bacterium]|nr:zinc-dependent metalloprotease family protein [Planctomycetota bacterium]